VTDQMTETALCDRCGRELTASDPVPMCAQCAVEVADGRIPVASEGVAKSDRGSRTVELLRSFGPPALAVVLALVMLMRVPALVGAFSNPAPAHDGTVVIDATGDRCVANLWTIASAMSEHEPVDATLTCPSSGRPYVTTAEGEVTVVACPDAAAHGATSISVRSDALVPRVR
jgi:hypothetical protein